MIIRKGPRRSSASPAPATSSPRRSRTSASTSARASRPASSTNRRRVHRRARRHVGLEGLPRHYPGRDLHLAERMVVHGIPGPYRVAGRRPDHDRRRRRPRRRDRRQRLHVRRRRDRPRGPAAARRLPGRARRRDRRGAPGNRIGDISHAVQTVVEGAGFSVVRSLVGHGVGRHYHEDPHVPNFGEPGRGPKLSRGMTIAIEPMITVGIARRVRARRRLVDLDRGRLARRAFRAHGRDHATAVRGS